MFELGNVVCTASVAEQMESNAAFAFYVEKALSMHATGNWGDLCDEDWESNQQALQNGGRLFSAYYTDYTQTEKIWIITEDDRSVTTVLFPNEY